MIVLIVDDQTNVVSGLISGINWERLQAEKILKAYNAFEAKALLQSQAVDVMLCDIEMPEEDGISLLRWLRKMNINTECIFLTSHADFIYAKEAIQLGGFDYIVQPARYEDIESSIIRAQKKIAADRRKQELSSYGQMFYEKKGLIIASILKDWLAGEKAEYKMVLNDLNKLNVGICFNTELYLVMFHILRRNPDAKPWPEQLMMASINNILSELFEHYGQSVLLSELSSDNYAFILYSRNNQLMDEEGLVRQLERFIQIYIRFFHCSISCYTGHRVFPEEIPLKAKMLVKQREENAGLSYKVFFEAQGGEESGKFEPRNAAAMDTRNQIDKVIQYIHNNIEKDIRRNEIAEVVFLNPDYLSRLFKKEVGKSLKEYIMQCKMKEAQSLLKTTNLPISMIAVKVGYTNFSHFSQVYKKILGVTPAEDRNEKMG